MIDVTFVFIGEGTSDDGLIPHLRTLIVRAGAISAMGSSRNYRGNVQKCLQELLAEGSPPDLIFVHRDADSRDFSPRRELIFDARSELRSEMEDIPVVPVVPVQELEAWLLTSAGAIREIVGKPSGRGDLGLPKLRGIEKVASPKELLQAALVEASGASGKRKKLAIKNFPRYRSTLLERLNIEGEVRQLESWKRLEKDVSEAVQVMSLRALT